MDAGSILDDLDSGEQLVLLTALPDQTYVPRPRGKKLHKSVPYRWAQAGVNGVRLEVMHVGSGLATTRAAVFRFFKRLTDPDGSSPAAPLKQRQKSFDAAESRLAAAGI